MKTYTHKTYKALEEASIRLAHVIVETNRAFYFRVFENRKCTEMHVFYKP